MKATPSPLQRPGMDFIAYELDRQIQINSELSNRILDLESRVLELEQENEDLRLKASGTNNVVLP